MGSVFKPKVTMKGKNGEKVRRQTGIWWIRYSRNGKRHYESSHSEKKGDAQRMLALREGDKARGLAVSSRVGRLTFDEAAADVVNNYKVNGKKTVGKVEAQIRRRLGPFFGGRRMSAITTADVCAYTAQRQAEGAANGTINLELATLKRAFRLAERAGTVLARPHVPLLALDNVRKGFFERREFEDVRAALPEYLRGVVSFAYVTGWRVPSEVLTLAWAQVDRKAQVVRLEPGTTKNREGRTLPYGSLPELVEVVEAAWAERERLAKAGTITPLVFHRAGQPIRSYRKAWAGACERAGLPGRRVHDFRRTAARNLSRAGAPDTVTMKIGGWKTRSVFDRYNITSEADISDALGRLADGKGKQRGNIAVSGRVAKFPRTR